MSKSVKDEALQKKRKKAEGYAAEPERFTIQAIKLEVRGEESTCFVLYVGGRWRCDCDFAQTRETCEHTMAAELRFAGFTLKQPFDNPV